VALPRMLLDAQGRSSDGRLAPLRRYATARTSPLLPGLQLTWADLHNHTVLSDGAGEPEDAYATMRAAGVDVAAVTDHAATGRYPVHLAREDRAHVATVSSLDAARWERAARAADAADDPEVFTALRGFEWTSPHMGHANVWLSADWVDPPGSGAHPSGRGPHGRVPPGPTMRGFHDWLLAGGPDGGVDGLLGLNHPGREGGRFEDFVLEPALQQRLVSLEVFNRHEDYLFEGVDRGRVSPLVACLDAGWTPGLLGVSDHHDQEWGALEDAGRAGLFLPRLTRDGVRQGLLSRLFFATREAGLRLVVTAASGEGPPVPMGAALAHTTGTVRLRVDLDRLPAPGVDADGLRGRRVLVQVLQTGSPLPRVVAAEQLRVDGSTDPGADTVHELAVPVSAEDGDWLVVRVVDPDGRADRRASGDYRVGRALAYAAPFWLRPG